MELIVNHIEPSDGVCDGLSVSHKNDMYYVTENTMRIQNHVVNGIIESMKNLSPHEFGILLHLVTGHCIASRDSVEVFKAYVSHSIKYPDHMRVAQQIIEEANRHGY